MKTEYDELITVTEMLRERALEKHRVNLAASHALAQELGEIDHMREEAQKDIMDISARRMVGADTAWQGWLLQRRAEVLQRTAMARAKEAQSLTDARKAYSRAEAALELQKEIQEKVKRKRLETQADTLDALSTMRNWSGT
ncbi:MAG: hypothetical protein JXQ89_01540 [Pelagimonas sp.]